MRRFWFLIAAILLLLLIIFLVAEFTGIFEAFAIEHWMYRPSVGVALLGIGLLSADVLLPVPSSLIMIAHGALFGFGLGTLLSLVGNIVAALLGFWIGRKNRALVARFIPPAEMERANQLLARWGMLALIVTRPVPLLAETMTIVAGTSRLTSTQLLAGTIAGSLPIAALYAFTGSTAVQFDSAVWSFTLALLVAGLFWLLRDPLNHLLTRFSTKSYER